MKRAQVIAGILPLVQVWVASAPSHKLSDCSPCTFMLEGEVGMVGPRAIGILQERILLESVVEVENVVHILQSADGEVCQAHMGRNNVGNRV